ncbi:hypothetical protein AAE478_004970 [Parahypoxylon ruwenzoriense]
MDVGSLWLRTANVKVEYIVKTNPWVLAVVSAIACSVLLVVAQSLLSAASKKRYLFVTSGEKHFLFSDFLERLRWFSNGPKVIHDAYEKYPNTIYEIPSLDRTSIVLPARFLSEIRELPTSIASNSRATSDFFVGKWTTLDYDIFGHANIEAIKTQYIARIGQQIGPASHEAAHAFNKHFTRYKDWTPIAAQPKVLQIVAQMVARTIVGPEVCRNPQWVESVIGYARNVFMGAVYLKVVPSVMRPLVAGFTPYIYRIHRCRSKIRDIIFPVIQQRLDWRQNEPEYWEAKVKSKEMNTVDWLVETSPPEEASPEMIAHRLTGVSFGAAHTTSNHVTNCILDLAADFDRWAPPLREEIKSVLGSKPTDITNADLSKMWKLDSFMKEVQRFHPPSKLSVNRKILQPLSLSSGDTIPKDAHISFAGVPMSMSEEFITDAKTFDGFRFERLRRDPQKAHSGLQFTSSYAGSLHFGHGRHMCPGRFMGSLISKLLIIELLQRYDLKLREGETRPQNLMFMDMDMPDPTYEVLFRDRNMET